MSDNGTDGRGKPCSGGTGGKSIFLGYGDTEQTNRICTHTHRSYRNDVIKWSKWMSGCILPQNTPHWNAYLHIQGILQKLHKKYSAHALVCWYKWFYFETGKTGYLKNRQKEDRTSSTSKPTEKPTKSRGSKQTGGTANSQISSQTSSRTTKRSRSTMYMYWGSSKCPTGGDEIEKNSLFRWVWHLAYSACSLKSPCKSHSRLLSKQSKGDMAS